MQSDQRSDSPRNQPDLFGMNDVFISEMVRPSGHAGSALWFAFHRNRLVVETRDDRTQVLSYEAFAETGLQSVSEHYLGRLSEKACYAVDIASEELPDGFELKDLRQLHEVVDEDYFVLGGRALQIVEWDRTHQYCGRCATRMEAKELERAKSCPKCRLLNFPRLSPAVIVLVERGDEILLARSPHFAKGMFSVLAGFVEPGETLEETVVREIYEEVGITVQNVRYFASQPWPFPNSLMLGFTADYASGDIVIDPVEIEEAGWFTPSNLPPIPGRISISRRLIDWYLAKHGAMSSAD